MGFIQARVAELADALDSKSSVRKDVRVRVSPLVLFLFLQSEPIMKRLLICLLVLLVVGCGKDEKSIRREFAAIADAKKVRVEQFLQGKQSDLSDYKVSVTIETDPKKYDTYPYLGQISFSYRINEETTTKNSDGEMTRWESDKLTADYRYSASERKWLHVHAYQSDTEFTNTTKSDSMLVRFDELRQAFGK